MRKQLFISITTVTMVFFLLTACAEESKESVVAATAETEVTDKVTEPLASEASQKLQNQSSDIIRIVELYILCRYSGHPGSHAELARLIRQFQPQTSATKAHPIEQRVQT